MKRHLTPSNGAVRLATDFFDAYDAVIDACGATRVWKRAVTWNAELQQFGYAFMVIGGDDFWVGDVDPIEAARKVLATEGEILNEQIAYERANGWSTD